jgi:hypothetical protein
VPADAVFGKTGVFPDDRLFEHRLRTVRARARRRPTSRAAPRETEPISPPLGWRSVSRWAAISSISGRFEVDSARPNGEEKKIGSPISLGRVQRSFMVGALESA